MRRLTTDEIKTEELRLLLGFDDYCSSHGLAYSLCGGTLLGAVRHRGFIPWDDDVDVAMPRADFDRLASLTGGGDVGFGFSVSSFSDVEGAPLILKLGSPDVFVKEQYMEAPRPLWVDVLPIDGLPADDGELSSVYRKAGFLRKVVILGEADGGKGRSALKRAFKSLTVPVIKGLRLNRVCVRRLEKLSRSIPIGSTGYLGILAWGLYGPGERMPDSALEDMAEVEFEGHLFPAFSCWDEYLTGIYGDYMKLPPEEDRMTHELVAWRVGGGGAPENSIEGDSEEEQK